MSNGIKLNSIIQINQRVTSLMRDIRIQKGSIGKIIDNKKSIGDNYCVEFINNINGHDGYHSEITGKNGHCWWVSKSRCELYSSTRKKYK